MVKTFMFLKNIILVCLLFTSSLNAQSIEVSASVDRNPVMADESFTLTVVANGEVDRNQFDTSSLLKDFVVGRTSTSSQTKMVNFTTTRSTTWSTVLMPKKQGNLTIPAFNIGGSQTQAIPVMVVPISASATAKKRNIYITTKVDVDEVYLQQQVHYTVKLHLATDLQRGSLSSPTLENADIRQIGKDKEYNEIVDGVRYRIIERSFAIIPQQSGEFTIEGPLFEGEVADNSRQSFGFFNRNKTVNRMGPTQTINVLAIPSQYSEHWLPSNFVQLNDEWQSNEQGFVVGEPITRTITLTAIGVVEEQLPEINSQYPSMVKTYPDQADTATVEKDNTLIAQRKESIAIIPSQVGTLVIPEVRIPWFNTITKKTEFATLAEKTIKILPTSGQSTTSLPTIPEPVATIPLPKQIVPEVKLEGIAQYWIWISTSLIILWLITLLAWWRHVITLKTRPLSHKTSEVRTVHNESNLWRALEKVLSKNQAEEIVPRLSSWLAVLMNNKQVSLEKHLQQISNEKLNASINLLLSARYSKNKSNWQSTELHAILREVRKIQLNNSLDKPNLAPLYPNG